MGLFGGGKSGRKFDWESALVAFANPQAGAMLSKKRGMEAEQEIERQQQQTAFQALMKAGMDEQSAATVALDPSQRARFLGDEYSTKQFGATGGSLARRDPMTGEVKTTYQAPWREQVGETVIEGGPNGGAPKTVYQGVRPVPVDGVGVFGMTGDGRVIGGNSGYNPYAPNAAPQDDEDEWEYSGGAGPQAPRPFRGGFNPYIPR